MGGLSCGLQKTRLMMRELSLLQMAPGTDSARLPQHADQHRPEHPILLAVDQQLGEGAGWGSPVRADRIRPVEVGEHQDVEKLGAGSRAESIELMNYAWTLPHGISTCF
jgi:hypothetical protein